MKMRRFATALERGRVSWRRAQAWGLVSRTMVSRDGASSEDMLAAVQNRSKECIPVTVRS